jgi:hypothetical protein
VGYFCPDTERGRRGGGDGVGESLLSRGCADMGDKAGHEMYVRRFRDLDFWVELRHQKPQTRRPREERRKCKCEPLECCEQI